MNALRIIVAIVILAFASLAVYISLVFIASKNGVVRTQTSAEAADLSAAELAYLKHRAIDLGDRNAAARIYWYYRFTKKDYTETRKWKYAVASYPGEDDGLPKSSN